MVVPDYNMVPPSKEISQVLPGLFRWPCYADARRVSSDCRTYSMVSLWDVRNNLQKQDICDPLGDSGTARFVTTIMGYPMFSGRSLQLIYPPIPAHTPQLLPRSIPCSECLRFRSGQRLVVVTYRLQ